MFWLQEMVQPRHLIQGLQKGEFVNAGGWRLSDKEKQQQVVLISAKAKKDDTRIPRVAWRRRWATLAFFPLGPSVVARVAIFLGAIFLFVLFQPWQRCAVVEVACGLNGARDRIEIAVKDVAQGRI